MTKTNALRSPILSTSFRARLDEESVVCATSIQRSMSHTAIGLPLRTPASSATAASNLCTTALTTNASMAILTTTNTFTSSDPSSCHRCNNHSVLRKYSLQLSYFSTLSNLHLYCLIHSSTAKNISSTPSTNSLWHFDSTGHAIKWSRLPLYCLMKLVGDM